MHIAYATAGTTRYRIVVPYVTSATRSRARPTEDYRPSLRSPWPAAPVRLWENSVLARLAGQ